MLSPKQQKEPVELKVDNESAEEEEAEKKRDAVFHPVPAAVSVAAMDENAAVTRSQWNAPQAVAPLIEAPSKEAALQSADKAPTSIKHTLLKPNDESETSSRFSKARQGLANKV